ncbi:MAG TPA: DUF983 domain-containing protein [Alphaproteobacteria bacterium]
MPITPTPSTPEADPRRWLKALRLGFRRLCPRCGRGNMFARYLKVEPLCADCGLALSSYRSDDAPPYFTILLVGHVVVPAMLMLEQLVHPPEWVHAVLWLPLTLAMTLLLLPRIKGALIGWQWAAAVKG